MSSKHYTKGLLVAFTLATAALAGCSTNATTNQNQSAQASSNLMRSSQQKVNDGRLASDIYNQFMQQPIASESHVNVSTWNGYVLLTGQVPSQSLKDALQRIAENTQGHTHIYNAVTVSVNTSHWRRMEDTWLTTRVKSAVTLSGDRCFILTENGIVYLMGIVHSYEASTAVRQAANISGVKGVVNAFQIVDQD